MLKRRTLRFRRDVKIHKGRKRKERRRKEAEEEEESTILRESEAERLLSRLDIYVRRVCGARSRTEARARARIHVYTRRTAARI